jgi:hypothetical protein
MSNQSPSRGHPMPQFSLANVLDAVSSADLPTRRRQEMAFALRTVPRALGIPLASIPADPRRLSGRLKQCLRAIGASRRDAGTTFAATSAPASPWYKQWRRTIAEGRTQFGSAMPAFKTTL